MAKDAEEIKADLKERAAEIDAGKKRSPEPSESAMIAALVEAVAEMKADQPLARDKILSLEEAAKQGPWSSSTLYRHAADPDSPFHKVGGRWVTAHSDFLEWARSGAGPFTRGPAEDPMPRPQSTRKGRAAFRRRLEEAKREQRGGT